jgi:peroxiredoxin
MRKVCIALLPMLAVFGVSAQSLRPSPGIEAPALELPGADGNVYRLSAYRGRVVLVSFWASWCEPCRKEMPSIEALRRSLRGMPFAVLAVNEGESAHTARQFADRVSLNVPLLLDHDGSAARAWDARALPSAYIVGPNGVVRYSHVGALDWSSPAVRAAIVELMPRSPLQSASCSPRRNLTGIKASMSTPTRLGTGAAALALTRGAGERTSI